jgi:hypothetical protein
MFGHNDSNAVSGKWAPLAFTTPYADLQAGRGRRFAQTCFAVLPAEDGGDDSIQKDVEEVLGEHENVSGTNTIAVSSRREGESTFTQLARFISGTRTITPVSDAYLATRPQFRVDITGAPLSPPILRRLSIRWLPNPDVREVRRYVLALGRFQQHAGGNYSLVGAEEQLEHLIRLATAAQRATMTDERGEELNVRVNKLEGPQELSGPNNASPVLVVWVTVSILSARPGPPFGYDAGVGWDSGHSWS